MREKQRRVRVALRSVSCPLKASVTVINTHPQTKTEKEKHLERSDRERRTRTQREEDTDGNRKSGALHLIAVSTKGSWPS